MISQLLFASSNAGKITEIEEASADFEVSILSLNNAEQNFACKAPQVEENGSSYKDNALIKAEAYFTWAKLPVISDDAGLEVEGLNWQPGLYSARYAGLPSDSSKNIEKLLNELRDPQKSRRTRLVCSLIAKIDQETSFSSEDYLWCTIAFEQRGGAGFGYDSVLIPEGFDKTLSELKDLGVQVDTHRYKAAKKLFLELQAKGLI
ncbi:MAG: non-canonical purine NTP pyrophosphatase [bacterium]|nr:non-canonical purine NTP pyrophosphatase [bacterium]